MAKIKIKYEVEKCIGCGTCAAVCPENWAMQGDKAKLKKTELEKEGCNAEAERDCPVQCIHVLKQ